MSDKPRYETPRTERELILEAEVDALKRRIQELEAAILELEEQYGAHQ